MDLCLRSSLPLLLLALTIFAMSLAISTSASHQPAPTSWLNWRRNATESAIDFTKNDLLLGSQDAIFWFLVPLFGVVSAGLCVVINYVALSITWLLYIPYNLLTVRPAWAKHEDGKLVIDDIRMTKLMLIALQEIHRPRVCCELSQPANNDHQYPPFPCIYFHSVSICISRCLHCTASNMHAGVAISQRNSRLPPFFKNRKSSNVDSDRGPTIISTITRTQSSSSCCASFRSTFPSSSFGYITWPCTG